MKHIKPYDDLEMIWSNDKQRYILTIDADKRIKSVYTQDLDIINEKLDETSLLVYTFYRTKTHTANKDFFDYLIATTEEYRKIIKSAMLEQLRADMESGYNDLNKQIPLNLQTFQSKDRDFFNRNLVCPMCENILSSARPFNLLYLGDYGCRAPSDNIYYKEEIEQAQDLGQFEELDQQEINELLHEWGRN